MSVFVDVKLCTGCGRCFMCCPVDAIRVWVGTCSIADICIDCNICVKYCPLDAIDEADHVAGHASQ